MKFTPNKLAFIISRLFGPLPLACVLWLLVAVKSGIGFWKAMWVYPIIFSVCIGLPALFTTYLVTTKRVKNIEWSNIKDRRKYFPFVISFSLFFLLVLTSLLTNTTTFHLTLLFSVIITGITLVYIFTNFKISSHIAVATITFAAINLYFGMNYLWLYLLLIPIIWARHTLKVHSLSQLLAGFLLPTALMILAVLIFGWPKVS